MKAKLLILITILIGLFLSSCEDDKKILSTYYVGFENTSIRVSEAEDETPRTVSVFLAAPIQSKEVKVTLSFAGGILNTDFVLQADAKYKLQPQAGSLVITIPAGELFAYFQVLPIDNLSTAEGGATNVVFEIINADEFFAGLGKQSKFLNYIIQDNDCPFDLNELAGTYDVSVCAAAGFYFQAGCGNSYTTSLSVGSDPLTLVDNNVIDAGNSVIITVNPSTLTTFLATQFAYNNASGLARNVGTVDLPLGTINTCAPSFVLNFYIIDNTGAIRNTIEATYTKQ